MKPFPGAGGETGDGAEGLQLRPRTGNRPLNLLYVVCVSAHIPAGTPWLPVNAFYHEHHFCFDAVTNSSVTQPLPSQSTVRSCLFWSLCHLVLMSCLFLKHETTHMCFEYQKQESQSVCMSLPKLVSVLNLLGYSGRFVCCRGVTG